MMHVRHLRKECLIHIHYSYCPIYRNHEVTEWNDKCAWLLGVEHSPAQAHILQLLNLAQSQFRPDNVIKPAESPSFLGFTGVWTHE